MNVTVLYFITQSNAFPQYRLCEKISKNCTRIGLRWLPMIHVKDHILNPNTPLRDILDYPEQLIPDSSPEIKDYLVIDFKEIE
jgi:hypothetical protein